MVFPEQSLHCLFPVFPGLFYRNCCSLPLSKCGCLVKNSKGPRSPFLQILQAFPMGFSNNCICYKRRQSHLNFPKVFQKFQACLIDGRKLLCKEDVQGGF